MVECETRTYNPRMLVSRKATIEPGSGSLRIFVVVIGIALGQVFLYGPSLAGRKVLLPLDILALPGVYIPRTPEVAKIAVQDLTLIDWVYVCEPSRRFAVSEFQAHRLPMWAPYEFGGVPCISLSPFFLLQCCTESPVILAWAQLTLAIVSGLGAYLFFRRALAVTFWPAAVGGWGYPLTGFFILWQGCSVSLPVAWLPWILLAVHNATRPEARLAGVGVSAATFLVLVSGPLDIAGQVLLGSGLYGLWRCREANKGGGERYWRGLLARLAVGWTLGFLLAAPYLLPVLEYSRTGARVARRSAGTEERPPVGLKALPQVILPDFYGTSQKPSMRFASGHHSESSAATYAGVLATMLVAPLAFCSRRHWGMNTFLVFLMVFGLSWCLDIPILVSVLRLPGMNMMSHNRLVFLASFAILALAVIGLEALLRGLVRWRWWLWVPGAILAGVFIWCLYLSLHLPKPIRTQIAGTVLQRNQINRISNVEELARMQKWFVQYYAAAAIWCGAGLLGWVCVRACQSRQPRLVPVLAGLLIADLLWFGHRRNVQCDPSLYFPRIPVLQALAKAPPGRVMGYGCLPAPLSSLCGLWDIRGYDGVDPARMVELVAGTAGPGSIVFTEAATVQMAPKSMITPAGDVRLPPVLDMLGVRYVIFRGSPPTNVAPTFQGIDYWVLKNPAALPRLYIPQRVELVTNATVRLQKLASPEFNAREVGYVETPVDLPTSCRGTAEIVEEIPTRITVSLRMETPGMVILADRWDKGWRAYLSGKQVPILCANHAIRGVVVPARNQTLQFRYEPASFAWGVKLAVLAGGILAGWIAAVAWGRARRLPVPTGCEIPT